MRKESVDSIGILWKTFITEADINVGSLSRLDENTVIVAEHWLVIPEVQCWRKSSAFPLCHILKNVRPCI